MNIKLISVGLTKFVKNERGETVPIPLEIQQIQPVSPDENLFIYYSKFFLNSAESIKSILVDTGSGLELGNVPAFLFLHGLELFAKGKLYVIDSLGKTTDDFGRHYGHNLNKVLSDLKAKGVNWDKNLTAEQVAIINKTGNDYQKKLYNYADGISHDNHLNVNVIEIGEIVNKIISNIE